MIKEYWNEHANYPRSIEYIRFEQFMLPPNDLNEGWNYAYKVRLRQKNAFNAVVLEEYIFKFDNTSNPGRVVYKPFRVSQQ